MKKALLLLAIFTVCLSCKEDLVAKPDSLIEKGKMIDIMYDLSILEASKFQNNPALVAYENNPSAYIFKKYNIDSIQLAQNNLYYASNYMDYKDMYDAVEKRINTEKNYLDSIIKIQQKKKTKIDSLNVVKDAKIKKDSFLSMRKRELLKKNKTDTIQKVSSFKWNDSLHFMKLKFFGYTDEYLKTQSLK